MDSEVVMREVEMGRVLTTDDAVSDGIPLSLLVGSDVISSELRQGTVTLAVFVYVHAGNIEDAIKLCRTAHRPWRSATIRSSLLFS